MKSAMLINQYGCFLAFAGYHAVDVPWQHSDLCQQAQEKTSDSSSKKKKKPCSYPIYEKLHRKTEITNQSLTQNSLFEDSSLNSQWVAEIQEKEKKK